MTTAQVSLAADRYAEQSPKCRFSSLDMTQIGLRFSGFSSHGSVRVIDAKAFGSAALKVVDETPDAVTDQEILYRDREPGLELVEPGSAWSFTRDGNLLRLMSEARQTHLTNLLEITGKGGKQRAILSPPLEVVERLAE